MYKPKLPTNVDPLNWVGPDNQTFTACGLIHCTHIPAEATRARPVPVVIMLHGWGGDEAAMWIFKQTLPRGVAAIAPRAPFELGNGGFIWFRYQEQSLRPVPDSLETGLNKLENFLDSLPALYPVDPTQLVIMGFSQGAVLGNAFMLTHPDAAVGVVSLAGAMPPVPQAPLYANLLAGLPVFVAHGVRDNIVPVSMAQQIRQTYTELGADVTYGEYQTAHKMNPQGMKDLKAWLIKLFRPVQ